MCQSGFHLKNFRVPIKKVGVMQMVYVRGGLKVYVENTKVQIVCIRRQDKFVYAEKTNSHIVLNSFRMTIAMVYVKQRKGGKRNVQGVPQSQTAALLRHQEEEETDKTKQAQIEQTYEKH